VVDAEVVPATPVAPAPSTNLVTLDASALEAMLARAVAAGVAQGQAAAALAASQPTPAEVVEPTTVRTLLTMLINKTRWHSEREWRTALATVDHHFPEDTDGAA
jgi:hypothetical protein